MSEKSRLEFRLGSFGKFIPIIIAVIFIFIAAMKQSNISGYVVAFFMAVILSIPFVKNEKDYGDAIMKGLTRPMFAVISMAIILATIAGKLISASGLVQTLASYVVEIGFTGGAFVAFTFLITCLLSFSTGTSVGTYLIMIPILFPVGVMAGASPAFMIGSIVSGSAFGDNLAPISDTTIASSGTQGADLGNVVKSRSKYSLPVAAISFILFAIFGGGGEKVTGLQLSETATNPISLVMLIVPIVIIALCLMREHLVTALSYGVIAGFIAGLITRLYNFNDILGFPGGFKVTGIFIDSVTGAMSTVAMLVGVFSLLGIMESSGVFESIGNMLNKTAKGVRSTEATVVGSIAILGMITGVIAVAIIAVGDLVRMIGERHGVDKYRRANLMDCGGIAFVFLAPWTVHCVLPAQLSSTFGDAFAVIPTKVATHNFYAIIMVIMLVFAIITGYGRQTKIKEKQEDQKSEKAITL
jgi:Na+/H+ antiporter NhaC